MKKEYWIILVVILVLVFGYFGRHRIRRMFNGTTPPPPVQTENSVPPSIETQSSSSATVDNSVLTTKTDSNKGDYLADTKGMTLYSYDKDTTGVSNCSGACLKAWPIYSADEAPATLPTDVTTVKATDGKLMYAYKGVPLYYYANDSKPGDLTGDGVGGVWHLVKP